jgi:hypothetical protein
VASVDVEPRARLVRTVETDDTPASASAAGIGEGVPAGEFEFINFTVVPDAVDTPELEVYAWGGDANGFVVTLPASSATSPAPGQAFNVTVQANGRTLFPFVTGVTQPCQVYAAGYKRNGAP